MGMRIASMQQSQSPIVSFGSLRLRNVERDKQTREKLISMGWRVIEIWQCQLKAKEKETTLNNLITFLRQ